MDESARWQRYWRYLTRGFRREVDEELAFHLDMRSEQLEAQGLSPEAAQSEARARFGDRQMVRSELERLERKRGRQATASFVIEELVQDLRYGARSLLKRPSYTILTASSLAVGIAAVTVMLSVVDSWLLRPLPARNPEDLVVIGASSKATGSLVAKLVSIPTARDIKARTDLFDDAAATVFSVVNVRLPDGEHAKRRLILGATGNYFSVLGVTPTVGRTFSVDDDLRRERVIVLTNRYWRTEFGAEPGVIGKTLYLNRVPVTVIGVTPAGFRGTEYLLETDAFIPVSVLEAVDPDLAGLTQRREMGRSPVIARKRPGVSLPAITAALDVLSRQLEANYPGIGEQYRLHAFTEARARPTLEAAGTAQTAEAAFGFLAIIVLLTASVNATNLILARGSSRQTELVVRRALGASRGRVLRQLITENVLVALVALGLGWIIASFAIRWLTSIPMSWDLPITWGINLDLRVFAMAAALTLIVGLLAGLGPALAASGQDLQRGIREGARGGTSRRGQRLRAALVVGQVAASMVVLVFAGLFAASVRQATKIDLGFEGKNILTFGLDAAGIRPGQPARPIFDRIRQGLANTAGVRAVAWADGAPLKGIGGFVDVYTDDNGPATTRTGGSSMFTSAVSPEYFATLRMPIVEGRAFTAQDDSVRRVAIVNRRAADLLWPGKSPIGRMIRVDRDGPAIEIVGVAKNSRYLLIGESPRPFLYRPVTQGTSRSAYFFIDATGDPLALTSVARAQVAAVDQDLVPFDLYSLNEIVRNSPNGMLPLRIAAAMASAIGLLATLLSLIGLYGIITFSVTQRTRELGLRMALGADRLTVLRSILVQGGRLVGAGIALGLVAAILGTRLLADVLVGVRATDFGVFVTAVILLTAVALCSAYLPARRASRIDPVSALKAEG
ncbi:MAG: ADOP family duplicated permease [Gemmatimonadales bacterium]